LTLVLASIALAAAPAGAAAAAPGPDVIPLPPGFQPEGVASGPGRALYVGSIPTGAIYRADPRTGEGSILVTGRAGRAATGLKFSRGLAFVSGGPTGHAYVYNATTGADVADLTLTDAPSFINDVVLTRRAAIFTDTRNAQLYRVARDASGAPTGEVTTIPITGELAYDVDPTSIDANGIVSGDDGVLLVIQSRTGLLFRVDHKTGASTQVALTGGDLANGDGMLLRGRTLYVVQNRLNRVAVVKLDRELRSGTITTTLTNAAFDVPTTIARRDHDLFAVNARFGTPPTPETTYAVVRLRDAAA
jgi:sugar lactone lactonase YvrE